MFDAKLCLAPPDLQGPCEGRVIQAHSVSKFSLRMIAREGHVYEFSADMGSLIETGGSPRAKLIGIGDASTFFGFCRSHDQRLFSPIENVEFYGTQQQLLLHCYRTLCREFHYKSIDAANIGSIRELDKGRDIGRQIQIQRLADDHGYGSRVARRKLRVYKEYLEKCLIEQRYDAIRGYCIEFDAPPQLMGSGAILPEVDFNGTPLAGLQDASRTPDIVFFSSFARSSKGYFWLSWNSDHGPLSQNFVHSFAAIPDHRKPDAAVRFLFEFCENIYGGPSWWESIPAGTQAILLSRVLNGSHHLPHKKLCLFEDNVHSATWDVADKRWL